MRERREKERDCLIFERERKETERERDGESGAAQWQKEPS